MARFCASLARHAAAAGLAPAPVLPSLLAAARSGGGWEPVCGPAGGDRGGAGEADHAAAAAGQGERLTRSSWTASAAALSSGQGDREAGGGGRARQDGGATAAPLLRVLCRSKAQASCLAWDVEPLWCLVVLTASERVPTSVVGLLAQRM